MASSTQNVISPAITEIMKIRPNSILDIGIGFGKWGFLCREYLEGWYDRVFPNQWQIKIDGIEIYKPYTELIWNEKIYDKIYLGDAFKVIENLPDYDLIIASDIIEHLEKEKAQKLIEYCIKKSNKMTILNIPLGKNWLNNKVVGGNQYNKHLSVWEIEEIKNYIQKFNRKIVLFNIYKGIKGDICLAIFRRIQ
jgi:hypothetical protein